MCGRNRCRAACPTTFSTAEYSNCSLRPSSQIKSVRQDEDGPTTASETEIKTQKISSRICAFCNSKTSQIHHIPITHAKLHAKWCMVIRMHVHASGPSTREKPQPWKVSLHPSCNRYVPQMDMTLPSDLCRICLEHVLGNCEPWTSASHTLNTKQGSHRRDRAVAAPAEYVQSVVIYVVTKLNDDWLGWACFLVHERCPHGISKIPSWCCLVYLFRTHVVARSY